MAVNLLEEDRLVYHDPEGDTFTASPSRSVDGLDFEAEGGGGMFVISFDRDAVTTLRDSLSHWLETGKLTQPTELELEALQDAQLAFEHGYDGDI